MKFSFSRFVTLVIALLAANGCSEAIAPVDLVSRPANLVATSSQVLTAVAGAKVAELPSVIVKDALGKPVAGVIVVFTVTSGEGTVIGANPETDASGQATLGGWILGPKAGTNIVVASALRLPSVTFVATGFAGPPASLEKLDGDGQTTAPGTVVPVSPLVRVKDANGNPVAGAAVTFAIVEGEATLTGAKQISNEVGIAVAGEWKLGVVGEYGLEARLEGVPSQRFIAHAVEPCGQVTPLARNSGYTGELADFDCDTEPQRADYYSLEVDKAGVYVFTESSSAFATSLALSSAGGVPIAQHTSPVDNAGVSSFKVLLSPGSYVLRTSTRTFNGRGKYSVSWNTSDFPLACDDLFITPGANISADMTDKDCVGGDNRFSRHYVIYLRAGVLLEASLTTTGYDDGYLALENSEIDQVAVAYGGYATAAKMSFFPTRSGFYLLKAGYADARTIGPFTLSVR
jgi:hypothetical protein